MCILCAVRAEQPLWPVIFDDCKRCILVLQATTLTMSTRLLSELSKLVHCSREVMRVMEIFPHQYKLIFNLILI